MGARALLLDEDTCATNFMIRDARMQARPPQPNMPNLCFPPLTYLHSILLFAAMLQAGAHATTINMLKNNELVINTQQQHMSGDVDFVDSVGRFISLSGIDRHTHVFQQQAPLN